MELPANLVAVRSDVAATLMIDGLLAETAARAHDELPQTTERTLGESPQPRLARLGYLARTVELERFEVARAPIPWLADRMASLPRATIAEIASAVAADEPLDKPAPGSGAPSWLVPGPGGHVRHFLAVRAAGSATPEAKRDWMFGFFVRCCEDAPGGAAV